MKWLIYEVGDGLGLGWELLDKRLGESLDGTRVESALLHLLSRVVIRLEPHSREVDLRSIVKVGVCEVDAVVEHSGFAEHQILHTYLIVLFGIFAAIKPC